MKRNRYSKFFPIIILLVFFTKGNNLYAQLLDKKLLNQRKEIVDFLIREKELPDSVSKESYFDAIYSRKLFSGDVMDAFQLGLNSPHNKRYFAVQTESKLNIYKSTDLLEDMPAILKCLKIQFDKRSNNNLLLIHLLQEVTAIYRYNLDTVKALVK